MNCRYFENTINDLARDQIMDAETRASALSHAESCALCASRLANERALTLGLRAMARSDESEQAPSKVEAALITAFRQQPNDSLAAFNKSAPGNRGRLLRRVIGAAAAAAAIIIIFALVATRLQSEPSNLEAEEKTPSPAEVLPKEKAPEPGVQQEKEPKIAKEVEPQSEKRRRPAPRRKAKVGGGEKATETAEEVIATDFLPVKYGDNLTSLEGSQVLRVKLPRSVLVSFGLPMNVERADEPIIADVLVGYDGVARAIRFVH